MTLAVMRRAALTTIHDLVMAAAAFVLSLWFRLGDQLFAWPPHALELAFVVFVCVSAGVFWWMRLDSRIWRYVSLDDLFAILRATIAVNLIFLVLMFMVTRLEDFPRSFVAINLFVMSVLLAGPRLAYRLWRDRRLAPLLERRSRADGAVPVLLVGASDGAELFITQMARGRDAPYRVVGIVDDKPWRLGRRINGVKVLGGIDAIPSVVERLTASGRQPRRLVVTTHGLDGQRMRRLLDLADRHGLAIGRLPRLTDLEPGAGDALSIRPIAVEDLLRRPQAVLDRAAMAALVRGRRICVTGAGGTIGGELVRQIAALEPAEILLVDNAEYLLYHIDLELAERHPGLKRVPALGDVRDRARLDQLLGRHRPELVFHAAAFKHVPMIEANPTEGVLTNVVGTRVVADACRAAGVSAMVLISTDKAVNPTSVMGATKRLAEAYCQSLDLVERAHGAGTRLITVRFGNVLGSTGSVVPLFQRQLARGGPLTITHPDIQRYFMTVREAVELVLQATVLGTAGVNEGGSIFVLDMGEPVRILDLAHQMIRLAGLRPGHDIEVVTTGLRPGEKLNEELFHGGEALDPTPVTGLLTAVPRTADLEILVRGLDKLAALALARRRDDVLAELRHLVPEYAPDPATSVSLEKTSRPDAAGAARAVKGNS